MRKSNYDKKPFTEIKGSVLLGWDEIRKKISEEMINRRILAVDCYVGVYEDEFLRELSLLPNVRIVNVRDLYKTENEIIRMTSRSMTTDVLFGYMSNLALQDYFDDEKVDTFKKEIEDYNGSVIIIGTGASCILQNDLLIFADMARWEIQQRFRRHEIMALGIDNRMDAVSLQYKRGYFIDWKICDRHKSELFHQVDYWIDSNIANQPKMISGKIFVEGIEKTVKKPFRVVPFFDPAPWGGQWMKDICDLDREKINYGWCFDCVPEENSLYLKIDDILFELPAIDIVLMKSRDLLGAPVESRFGKEFPIRFDFLDTIDGGNLSLQVHPTTQYVHDFFGIHYTQDESYYILDATDDAVVYLGLKNNVDSQRMIEDLRLAQDGKIVFDANKYVNKIKVQKHDHFLIPGGTIHCSGAGSMVLEISSTPNLFTFKLWDWERLGLDGKPRPINIERGEAVLDWERDADYVYQNLYNHISLIDQGNGWMEERTGLHPNEFIETRRHHFSVPVLHDTGNSVNVLNLIDGEEAIVESPSDAFDPFVVHYAETFIVPACIGKYTIRPYGKSEGKACMTIKASVRF